MGSRFCPGETTYCCFITAALDAQLYLPLVVSHTHTHTERKQSENETRERKYGGLNGAVLRLHDLIFFRQTPNDGAEI